MQPDRAFVIVRHGFRRAKKFPKGYEIDNNTLMYLDKKGIKHYTQAR